MKKVLFTLGIIATLIACNNDKKTNTESATKPAEKAVQKDIVIDNQAVSINWTAYKTTEKKPVKGKFTKYMLSVSKGNDIKTVLDNAKMTIVVNSINSGNEGRDAKLVKSFFGTMTATQNLIGTLKMTSETAGMVSFRMNAITFDFPVTINSDENAATISGVMNLDNWKAQAAITALNIVCKDKHKGADGISKTWSDVAISVTIPFKK